MVGIRSTAHTLLCLGCPPLVLRVITMMASPCSGRCEDPDGGASERVVDVGFGDDLDVHEFVDAQVDEFMPVS